MPNNNTETTDRVYDFLLDLESSGQSVINKRAQASNKSQNLHSLPPPLLPVLPLLRYHDIRRNRS